MSFNITTAATIKPLSIDEVKDHLIIDNDFNDDDELIDIMIETAVNYVENHTRRALLTQTITAKYDAFAPCFELERPVLQSVTSISYIDTAGDTQVVNSSEYTVDTASTPPRIVPAYGYSWPSTRCIINAVTIVYVAGYTNKSLIPNQIRHALLLMIGDMYENRENTIAGVSIKEQTFAVEALLSPYVVWL